MGLTAGHLTQRGEGILEAIVSYQFADLRRPFTECRGEDRSRRLEGVDCFRGVTREELLELSDRRRQSLRFDTGGPRRCLGLGRQRVKKCPDLLDARVGVRLFAVADDCRKQDSPQWNPPASGRVPGKAAGNEGVGRSMPLTADCHCRPTYGERPHPYRDVARPRSASRISRLAALSERAAVATVLP